MKRLTNKWREGAMLLSFLLISSLAGIFTACDDIEDEYITDTPVSYTHLTLPTNSLV